MPEDLQTILTHSIAFLAEGTTDPASPWRTMTLASSGTDGHPSQRSVVLRRWWPQARWLDVYTDSRSAKCAELRADHRAALHGWDAAARVQLRVSGTAELHQGDAIATAAWAALSAAGQSLYGAQPAPGTPIAAHTCAGRTDAAAARAAFCVIRLHISQIEWLRLEQGCHLRARFCWHGEICDTGWIAP